MAEPSLHPTWICHPISASKLCWSQTYYAPWADLQSTLSLPCIPKCSCYRYVFGIIHFPCASSLNLFWSHQFILVCGKLLRNMTGMNIELLCHNKKSVCPYKPYELLWTEVYKRQVIPLFSLIPSHTSLMVKEELRPGASVCRVHMCALGAQRWSFMTEMKE